MGLPVPTKARVPEHHASIATGGHQHLKRMTANFSTNGPVAQHPGRVPETTGHTLSAEARLRNRLQHLGSSSSDMLRHHVTGLPTAYSPAFRQGMASAGVVSSF